MPGVGGNLLILLDQIARPAEAREQEVVDTGAGEAVPLSDLGAVLALEPAGQTAAQLVLDAL